MRTISRRAFLAAAATVSTGLRASEPPPAPRPQPFKIDPGLARDWLGRWQKKILGEELSRSCDKETGEELGWLVSPLLNGFYYGYLATEDTHWLDRLVDWSDAWTRRAVKEPDGCPGWPKEDGASTGVMPGLFTDNILGEAMALRPMVLFARLVHDTPKLQPAYGKYALAYLRLSEQVFEKWDQRGCWRDIVGGGVWVVAPYGIDRKTGGWTSGYQRRDVDGFTLPANKQNLVALWLLSMSDATAKSLYRDRAQKWFKIMKSRMHLREGKYLVWNYWDPAGKWDYQPDGATRHWVGVHPNGGYYDVDVEGIVAAMEHQIVFDEIDLQRLIATNRDFMWNQKIDGASFARIDGQAPDPRWKQTPGVLWTALISDDTTLRRIFERNFEPDSWAGMGLTPRYLCSARG